MAGTKKQANPKNNDPAMIRAVAKKIATNPKFADDANLAMSANAVITRAKKTGKTDADIAKMTAAQLRKFLG